MCRLLDWERQERGEIVKFIAEDQGRESCYSLLQCSGSGVTVSELRQSEWTAETLVTPRASCQERDNQQEFSLRLSPPPDLHTTDRDPLGPSRVQYFTAVFTMRYTSL